MVDDHTLIRQGIVGLLRSQPDMEVAGEAADGHQALAQARELQPAVVLMDIAMPELGGLEATRQLRALVPTARVLILTVHDREDYLFAALQAGAYGYILKGADVNDLLAAIRAVNRGEIFLYPAMTTKLVADYLRRAEAGEARESYDGLTPRQREVLRLIAQGLTAAEIGRRLYLSPHTVESHRDNIMARLGLHSKAELIRYAIRRGIIDETA
ncbi:MAG: response regulator transcription factor [Chloroflexota bacterium]